MSHANTTSSVPQSQANTPESIRDAIAAAVAWWPNATAEEQGRVLADAVEVLGSGLEAAEYLTGLADFSTAAEYIADATTEPEPATEPTVDVQAPAPELSDEAKVLAQQEASRKLQATVREWVKGERGLTKHRLEAGKLASEYIAHRVVVMRHDRAAAVKCIAGRLLEVSGVDVDVNALVATYEAARLLGEGIEVSKAAYSALECFRPLVERTDMECWTVCAGVEAEAVALFRESLTSQPVMPVRTLEGRVKLLDAKAKAVKAEHLAALAADPKAGKKLRDQAAKAAEQASKAAAKVGKGDTKPPATETPAATGKPAPAAKPEECRQPVANLTAVAQQGTAKDVAELAAELVNEHDEPDDVLEQLLCVLKDSKALSRKAKRALDAALLVLTREDRPSVSPVQVAAALSGAASANGAPAAAVA